MRASFAMSRTLLFAEVPNFYAAAERAADLTLTERPVIVGGDPRKRATVQSATPDALARGVVEGMPLLEALARCPRARALRTNMRRYREVSLQLKACLRQSVERIEPVGLSAAYMDLTELGSEPSILGQKLQEQVRQRLALPLRVGIAAVKFVARLAAEEAQASGLRRVLVGEEAAFLAPLCVARLPGVGPHAEERLAQLGVRQIGEVVALGRERLEALFGNRGPELLALARGAGDVHVRGTRAPQSLSQESTFESDVLSVSLLEERVQEIARGLESVLHAQSLATRRVTLKLRYANLESVTRSQSVTPAVTRAHDIAALAQDLLAKTRAGDRPVRLLGISLGSFTRARRDDRQLDLFPRSSS